ncbi:unnamed protein product [Rotaria magnacalcarata]
MCSYENHQIFYVAKDDNEKRVGYVLAKMKTIRCLLFDVLLSANMTLHEFMVEIDVMMPIVKMHIQYNRNLRQLQKHKQSIYCTN